MTYVYILIALVVFGLGGLAGWRGGRFMLNKKMIEENDFLRTHVETLKETIRYWSEQSHYNKEVQNSTINNHNNNLNNTLHTILSLLQTEKKENPKEEERNKIEEIIKVIKIWD